MLTPIETIREALMMSALALENDPVPEERKRIAAKCREAITGLENLPLSATEIQSRGGRAKSEAKAAAVRANGAKGGRPRKAPIQLED